MGEKVVVMGEKVVVMGEKVRVIIGEKVVAMGEKVVAMGEKVVAMGEKVVITRITGEKVVAIVVGFVKLVVGLALIIIMAAFAMSEALP